MEYFIGTPASTDTMWLHECASVAQFCVGRGLDPGAGGRTLTPDVVRLDANATHRPAIRGSAITLPFADNVFDYVFTCHLLEHMRDPRAALTEWLRVVRPGGHVACIMPNTLFTQGQNTDPTPHWHEWTPRDFLVEVLEENACPEYWFRYRNELAWVNATVVHFDEAQPHWSFGVVLEKDHGGGSIVAAGAVAHAGRDAPR